MIRYGAGICANLSEATEREWLETNGLGGFASSTIIGLNTRRYHGLLFAALDPPSQRVLLLSKIEETLVINGKRYELSANSYTGATYPDGFKYQQSFRLDPFPIFTWRAEDLELNKSVFLVQGENAVVVQYILRAQGAAARHDCKLELRPLIAFRDYHGSTHANSALNTAVQVEPGCAAIAPYPALPTLYCAHDADAIETSGAWYYNFEYARERERGLDFREDLYQPFTLHFDLSKRTQATVVASLEKRSAADAGPLRLAEVSRRRSLGANSIADPFVVKRGEGASIIAGYPWFEDWGRDTMISLPGLTLATGRHDVARAILLEFAQYVSQGMLPNRFPDEGRVPEYNTVDAALWYFEAVRAYCEASGDYGLALGPLYPVLRDIVEWHGKGTRYGIQVDTDGLLRAGAPGVQLTWMDAKAGDWVVTPRAGKPVEIQALWHNALCVMRDFAARRGEAAPYAEMAERARASFAPLFWNEEAGCLYDVLDGEMRDPSIRPNQLFAISLPHKLLEPDRARRVLDVAIEHLLTPFGLRTLAPGDRRYNGRYEGDARSRDGAYHQGTVWPWLMGPFAAAYLDAYGGAPEARAQVRQWLAPLAAFRDDAGVGQIPEIFDGDPPHRARGCIAQAWSVAEFLRASRLVS